MRIAAGGRRHARGDARLRHADARPGAARAYLRAAGLRRLLLPVRLPGETFRRLRAGGNLTPEHADGRGTFEEALAVRFGGPAEGVNLG